MKLLTELIYIGDIKMKKINNNYQLSKTLRFGLSQKSKVKREGYVGEIYESHKELSDLVKISEDRIKKSVSKLSESELSLSLDKLRNCMNMIADFLSKWYKVYSRTDQIALEKDYYKVLSKKIGFEGFWYDYNKKTNRKVKKPQSRIIGLSTLSTKDENQRKRNEYIVEYWKDNFLSVSDKYNLVNEKLNQFETALKINRTDNKPNEVELRKCFLSLVNLVKETLNPLCLNQITFPKLEGVDMTEPENQQLVDFAVDNQSRRDLLNEIADIKKYFEENGGNVPYCRATLNPLTAIKNPNSTDNSIDRQIKSLGADKILKTHKDSIYFDNHIESMSLNDKIKRLKNEDIGLVERSLMFKYKAVPAIVQYEMAKTLSKTLGREERKVLEFLKNIGQVKSPAKDYADLEDKNDFNLEAYPLKVAFDYAWENLARSLYNEDAHVPVAACKKYLKAFGVDENSSDLRLYSQLQELKEKLSTLEHNNPSNRSECVDKANKVLSEIDWKEIGRNGELNKTYIAKWLKTEKKEDDDFKTAKQQIGLFRGGLKNKNERYKELTELFKGVSMEMGKTFAEMRDKITGAAELNKVTHYAMIVEDGNFDKYVLLQEFVEHDLDKIYSKVNFHQKGFGFKTYQVNSVTSNAISKMIKKEKQSENETNTYVKNVKLSPEEKEARSLNVWKRFIIKKGYDSEFNLVLKNKELEQLKKEIDAQCYKLEERYIDRDVLNDLVQNKKCLLLPIVNQDLAKEVKGDGNQFTKDWNAVYAQDSPWRLTPEFRVSYRKPTNNYPTSMVGDKRYSRFQLIGHFLCDYIPKTNVYMSNREQISNFKDNDLQKKAVGIFNEKLIERTEEQKKIYDKFYVFGIDRGQKELATLCVIDQDKKIIGDFEIYTRSFNSITKQWEHKFLRKSHILDLSNLRVETTITIDGKDDKRKVLVDLSEVKVKDKNGNYTKPDKMQIKMQQLAYIRKLQFQMQTNPDVVLAWYENNPTKELILENFVDNINGEKGLVSFYGSAIEELKDTLPLDRIEEMLRKFKTLKLKEKEGDKYASESINALVQLEPVDNLKNGVVANMIGVVAFLLEKFNYQVYISLEDLSKPFSDKIVSGISGVSVKLTNSEGRRADVEKYAGLGLYNFFEVQLLKKLHRIQESDKNIVHLVPAFRAIKNYDHIAVGKDKVRNQFGIVFFVDADSTSKMCPVCGTTNSKPNKDYNPDAEKGKSKDGKDVWLERDKSDGNDIIRCFVCGFDTTKQYEENPLKYIKSGDDNAAYLISSEAVKAYELATALVNSK